LPAAVAVCVAFLAPVLWMAAASLKPESAIHADVSSVRGFLPMPLTLANYEEAIRRGDVVTTLINTFIAVSLIALGGLLVNGPAAYAFARMRFPGRELLFVLLVTTIIIPLEVIVIPLFMTVRTSRGLIDLMGERPWTLAALSVPFFAKAFNIFLLRQYFLALPRSLEEAAFLDGTGWWGTFWRVAVPNAKPAIVTVVLLDFVVHWNDFLWPLVICQAADTRTVQLGLGNFFTQPPISWGAILAFAVLATIPMMLAFTIGQRWIVQSLTTTGIRE
jgi:multiple sugar transport system permease protein/fructooligosaccharide transport system permease protein